MDTAVTKQAKVRGGFRGMGWVAGVVACLVVVPMGLEGQMAPRYRGNVPDAPTRQLTLPTPPPVSSPNAAVVEDIIARVNDQIIDRSDVMRQEQLLQEEARAGKIAPADLPQMQRDLLREMIDEQLLLSRGKELDVNVDAEVVRRMDDLRKQNHLDSMEALEKAVRDSGISYEDWRADLKNQLVRQMVIRDEVARSLKRPTPKDEQAYYDAHKQEFVQPEKVRLSEILVPTPENATDAQVAEAQAKADGIAAKLKAGAKFEDLAKQYSGGQTADKGGDLGMFERGQLAKVLEDQTFDLQAGQWTKPIRTRQGFVVLEVTQHVAAGVPPLKDVEEQVEQGMYDEQMQPALRKYLTGLREKAYIDIAPGFVDTGASSKEVKPVFAANTPPPVKKKTAQQKGRLVSARSTGGSAAAVPVNTATATTPPAAVSPVAGAQVKTVSSTPAKKKKKVKREKIRFGQAPENSLPSGPNETLPAGSDRGAGATSSVLPSTTVAEGAAIDQMSGTNTLASADVDPLGPTAAATGKTRFSDRAAEEHEKKLAEKAAKVKQKALETPAPVTAQEQASEKVQNSALGLEGDNATKKKKKKVKGAPKERMQEQAPAPAAPKPDATPIPPKSVRQNGEPANNAPTADKTTLPPVTAPAPGSPVDTTPLTPANPVPAPMPPQ